MHQTVSRVASALLLVASAGCGSRNGVTDQPDAGGSDAGGGGGGGGTLAGDPATLDFGGVPASSSKKLDLRLHNGGSAPVQIAAVKLSPATLTAFTIEGVPDHLVAGASATVSVTYQGDTVERADTGSLVITTDSATTPTLSVGLTAHTAAATCRDGVKNGAEADVDCGGACAGCAAGHPCAGPSDCDSSLACLHGFCGACDATGGCRTGQVCTGGQCVGCTGDAQCPSGMTCQQGACTSCPGSGGPIDTRTDPLNCGACGRACTVPLHAAATCVASSCGRTRCQAGYYDIDGATTPGCESTCAGSTCTGPGGKQVTLSAAPLPETGAVYFSLASGASVGAGVQTNPKHSSTGVLGDTTPTAAGGAVDSRDGKHINRGGFTAVLQ